MSDDNVLEQALSIVAQCEADAGALPALVSPVHSLLIKRFGDAWSGAKVTEYDLQSDDAYLWLATLVSWKDDGTAQVQIAPVIGLDGEIVMLHPKKPE